MLKGGGSLCNCHHGCVSQVLSLLFDHPELSVQETVDRNNWRQIRDRQLIELVVNDIINTDPKVVSCMCMIQQGKLYASLFPPLKKNITGCLCEWPWKLALLLFVCVCV